jgi:uncharacterized lipoprotein
MENSEISMERIGMSMEKIGMTTTGLAICFLLVVAGCSTNSERTDYKKDAARAPALEVPPDLVLPSADGRYAVPDGNSETVAIYSEYAKNTAAQNQACVCKDAAVAQPKVPLPASAVAATSQLPPPKLLDRPDGSKSILISEPFDHCWLKVSQALDLAGIMLEDKDRSKGLLYLKGGHNQLSVQAQGDAASCEVSANNGSGASNSETKRIIDALYKKLNK